MASVATIIEAVVCNFGFIGMRGVVLVVWLNGLTTSSSATAERGALAAWWGQGGGRKQPALALLGICDRVIRAKIPTASVYRRLQMGAAGVPKTLGEHLRRVRIDRGLTNVQTAQMLGVAYQTVERWEHDRTPIKAKNRAKIIAFIGFDPNEESATQADDAGAGNL